MPPTKYREMQLHTTAHGLRKGVDLNLAEAYDILRPRGSICGLSVCPGMRVTNDRGWKSMLRYEKQNGNQEVAAFFKGEECDGGR